MMTHVFGYTPIHVGLHVDSSVYKRCVIPFSYPFKSVTCSPTVTWRSIIPQMQYPRFHGIHCENCNTIDSIHLNYVSIIDNIHRFIWCIYIRWKCAFLLSPFALLSQIPSAKWLIKLDTTSLASDVRIQQAYATDKNTMYCHRNLIPISFL